MRKQLSVLLFAAALLTTGCARMIAGESQHGDRDLKERDEMRQSYRLTPGARVEVAGISGMVKIETANTDTAEVSIVRYAATRAALEHHKITVDHSADNLTVRGEKNDSSVHSMLAHLFTRSSEVRQEVTLKLPRNVRLFTNGVNGRVTIGEVDGAVAVHGVNGRVEIAQALDHAEVNGVNGGVTMTLAKLGEKGVSIHGVNGSIELRFAGDVNASVDVHGINGSVRSDAPDIVVEKDKDDRSNVSAQIGKGGAPISLHGINGGVRLSRLTTTEASSVNNANAQAKKTASAADNDSDESKEDDE